MLRTTLLFTALTAAVGISVAATSSHEIVKKMPAIPELQKVNGKYVDKTADNTPLTLKELSEKGLPAGTKGAKKSARIRAGIENPRYEWKIDSVVGTAPDGTPTVRQTFVFDERGNSKLQQNFVWNAATGDWQLTSIDEMDWNDSNAMTRQKRVDYSEWGNFGREVKYHYGENQVYPESAEFYSYDDNLTNGQWQLSQKSFWKYDSNNFMTEEIIQALDENGNMVNYSKAEATYNVAGQQTFMAEYLWNNGEWVPNGSRVSQTYNADGMKTNWIEEEWNGTQWQYVKRIRQEWDRTLLTYQAVEFFNTENNDWYGSQFMPSGYTDLIYDSKDRLLKQLGHSWDFDSADWVNDYNIIDEYVDFENGGYRQTSRMFDVLNGNRVFDQVVYEYNQTGNLTYQRSEHTDGVELMPLDEMSATYDAAGINLLEQTDWMFEGDMKMAFVKQQHTWDADGMPVESYYWHGKLMTTGEGEPEEWENFTHFTYGSENGQETSRMCYSWDASAQEYMPSWGNARTFDFAVPVNQCCYWTQTDLENAQYMITSKRAYTGVGSEWEYEEGIYYNSKFINSGIENTFVTESNVIISPNPAVDTLTVTGADADRYEVYSMQGALMISTASSEIDVTSLPKGIYLLRAGKVSAKFIKK